MRIAMLATAGAIAFAFSIGSVSAADQFTTLNGVKAARMSSAELNAVKGMDHHFFVNGVRHDTDQHQNDIEGNPATGAGNFVLIDKVLGADQLAAPAYRGLILHACVVSGGVITGPTPTATSVWCVPAS